MSSHNDAEVDTQVSDVYFTPCHWGLCVLTLLFALISIPIVYSASTSIALDNYDNTDYFLWRQIGFVFAGLIGLVMVSRLSPKHLNLFVWTSYIVALVGLLATAVTPLSVTLGAIQGCLNLGPIELQMSEIAKLALVGVMAHFWSRANRTAQKTMWPWIAAAAIALPLITLVFVQPYLSTALLLFILLLGIAVYAGVPISQMAKILAPLFLLIVIVVGLCRLHQMPLLNPYQQDRIAAHFFSGGHAETRGDNPLSLAQRALKQGGLLGAGPGKSVYKLGQLPAPHTDFILAVIGEEWGLIGLLGLLMAYSLIIFFCFQIGHSASSSFEALLCSGVGTMLAIQIICNAGVVTGLMPITNMPLPLLSYGGSGLIVTLIGLGIVLSISRRPIHIDMGIAYETITINDTRPLNNRLDTRSSKTLQTPRPESAPALSDDKYSLEPPKFLQFLLYLFIPKKEREPLLGDLSEEYWEVHSKFDVRYANIWFVKQVLFSIWPFIRGSVLRLVVVFEVLQKRYFS